MAWTYESTKAGYGNMWRSATLKPSDEKLADQFASKVIENESRYKGVEAATGVPWFFIGALHMRESSCNFNTHLHNGDPLTARTTHVPAGRPSAGSPPFTWEQSAIDALQLKGFDDIPSWAIERMLYSAEIYNGTGYVNKGENSPYVWAGTNHEQKGKYVADGKYDPNAEDTQLGIA